MCVLCGVCILVLLTIRFDLVWMSQRTLVFNNLPYFSVVVNSSIQGQRIDDDLLDWDLRSGQRLSKVLASSATIIIIN